MHNKHKLSRRKCMIANRPSQMPTRLVALQVLNKDYLQKWTNGKMGTRWVKPYNTTKEPGKGLEVVPDPTYTIDRVYVCVPTQLSSV